MTVCGGWSLVKHETGRTTAITLWCRSWQCPDCLPYRVSGLKKLAASGMPDKFITITVNPAVGESVEARAYALSNAWKVVVKRARRKWKAAPIEYLCVFEETRKGEPHLHIVARAPYIPQRWLSEQMDELISAPIVDIRAVRGKKMVANYVAKYVGKGPRPFGKLKRYWSTPKYQLERKAAKPDTEFPWSGWTVEKASLWRIKELWQFMGYAVTELNPHRIETVVSTGPPPYGQRFALIDLQVRKGR